MLRGFEYPMVKDISLLSDEELQICDRLLDETIYKRNLRWELANTHHINARMEAMNFVDKPYLVDIYSDYEDQMVIKKAVQCGATEFLILTSISFAELGFSSLYVLPTRQVRDKFVFNRVDVPFNSVPYYRERLKGSKGKTDNVGLKQYGNGTLNYVGSESINEFVEFAADVLIVDENDNCNQKNLTLALGRLDSSLLKYIVRVGKPTWRNYGIDLEYELTDKKQWFIKCVHCGDLQGIDFFKHVVREIDKESYELIDPEWSEESSQDIRVYCLNCDKGLDRLKGGEWVNEFERRGKSGYHLSQLFVSTVSIREIFLEFERAINDSSRLQVFYNEKLGLAYTPQGISITWELLDKLIKEYTIPFSRDDLVGNVFIGVDVGKVLHYVIAERLSMNESRIIDFGVVGDFSGLRLLFIRWKPKGIGIDLDPEVREAKRFRDNYPSHTWLVDYVGMKQDATTARDPMIDHIERIVKVDRTQTLDIVSKNILNEEYWFPKNVKSISPLSKGITDLYHHLSNSVRVLDEERQRSYWKKVGEDHFFHALNYLEIAKWCYDNYGSPEVY